ncbi:MAG: hypothetical protein ACK5ZJ_22890 [Acidobacteriota bacterium]
MAERLLLARIAQASISLDFHRWRLQANTIHALPLPRQDGSCRIEARE